MAQLDLGSPRYQRQSLNFALQITDSQPASFSCEVLDGEAKLPTLYRHWGIISLSPSQPQDHISKMSCEGSITLPTSRLNTSSEN
jgi:hypothetical protein